MFCQRTIALASIILAHSCSDDFGAKKATDKSSLSLELASTLDAAGNTTAAVDPSSSGTQVLKAASGSVAGSAIAFPAGSLAISGPFSVTIGEGETLASSNTTQQLGLENNAASAAGPSVSFVPSVETQGVNPFTLNLPMTSSSGLALGDTQSSNENLVVMYKWMKVENGATSYAVGLILRSELTVSAKGVQFQTTKFGTFQLAVTQTKVTEKISKPTDEPPVLRADAGNPLVGVWQACREPRTMGSNQPPTEQPRVFKITDIATPINYRCTLPTFGSVPSLKISPQSRILGSWTNGGARGLGIVKTNAADLTMPGNPIDLGSNNQYQLTPAVPGGMSLEPGDRVVAMLTPGCSFIDSTGSSREVMPYEVSSPAVESTPFPVTGVSVSTTVNHLLTGTGAASLIDNGIYKITVPSGVQTTPVSVNQRIVRVRVSGSQFAIFNPDNEGPSLAPNFVGFSASYNYYAFDFHKVSCRDFTLPTTRIECSDTLKTEFDQRQAQISANNNNTTSSNQNNGPWSDNLGIPPERQLFALETVKLTNSSYIYSRAQFDGPSCTGRMINRTEEVGNYTLGARASDNSFAITINKGNRKAAIIAPEAVGYANSHPATAGCGVNTWQPAVPKDLATTKCSDEDSRDDKSTAPDAVKIDGNRIIFRDEGTFDAKKAMIRQ